MTGGAILAMAIAILLSPNNLTHADGSATVDVNASIEAALKLELVNCDASPDETNLIIPNLTPAQAFSSACQTLSVSTNAPGYKLSAKSSIVSANYNSGNPTNALLYINATSKNPIPAIPMTTASLAAPAGLTPNHWGIAIADQGGFDADTTYASTTLAKDAKYASIPVSETQLHKSTELTTVLDQFKLYYAVSVNYGQEAGVYVGAVTYTAVGEPVPEPVYPEVLAVVPNVASTIAPSGDGAGSNGPQFSIVGSGFGAGPIVTIGGQPCTEVVVNSAGTALTCSGPTANLSVGDKAVVVTNIVKSNNDKTVAYDDTAYPTLQALTVSTCQDLPLRLSGDDGNVSIFRDARDSQLYYVARLADEKCWMLDNLKYKPNGDTTGTVTPGFSATQIVDPIPQAYCYNNTNKPVNNITKCGLLYNFYTASAGADSSVASGDVASSICPTSWRLPTGRDANGDLLILNASMNAKSLSAGSNANYNQNWQPSGAFSGVYSGYYNGGFNEQGTDGYLWSSSVASASNAFILGFYPSTVYPGHSNIGRGYWFGVRCVIGV
jgi:uncharacterized protein (TIGR02145 family)